MKIKNSRLAYVTLSLVGILFLSGAILSHSISSTYAHENTLNITIPSACTFSSGGGNYSVSMLDGSTEINANSITTSCNDASGYAIYAVGYSGDSDTGNNTDLINTANSTYNIKTDGSSDTGSNWKLKFTVVSDATIAGSYNTYQNIPSTYTKIASYNANTASGIITPHYQINLTGIQQPGTYVGQVKYVLVHPNTMSPTYTINYNANGGTGSMTSSMPSSFESFTLPTSTLTTPTGYSFAGWCTVQDQTQTPQTTCAGTTYTDGGAVPSGTVSAGNTLTLYAVWESAAPAKLYMQDLDKTTCQTLTASGPITVYDRRDESDYTVRYINDACWMTQNLRITGTISATDSNFSTQSSWNVHVNDLTSGNTYTEARSHVADAASVTAASDAGYTTTLDGKTIDTKILGVWYNYCAASAGTVCAQTQTNASEDICPANWHLPIYNTDTTNYPIGNIYGMTGSATTNGTNNASLFNPVYGGYYFGGTLRSAGAFGYWWSATALNTNSQYNLYYNSGSLYTSYYNKRYGNYIRCVRTS